MKFLALWMLRVYKRWVSPAFPPACRYVPTCSEYAMEAVERYGALRGGAMAAWRVLRCHPFVEGGLDPVLKAPPESHSFAKSANEWGTQVRGQECPRHTS
jgi:putative membrane protein insertion efficiency factor